MAKILIVDDEPKVLKLLETLLRVDGQDPVTANDGSAALKLLSEQSFDLMISDIRMTPMDGMELFRNVHDQWPHLPVILLTAYGTIDTAQSAMQNGVFDYLTKPFKVDELIRTVKLALSESQKKAELAGLRNAVSLPGMFAAIVAESEAMRRVCEQLRRVAPTDASVLMTGESGTGKEMLAKVLHDNSRRRENPFRPINCAALTATDLEGELFGLAKTPGRPGLFATAQGGTLFLDEIAHVPMSIQEKLLGVLRDRQMFPGGSKTAVPVNVRVLAASDVRLEERVRQGSFSQDLYLRLAVIELMIPPLRERTEDILPMVQHFLRHGKKAEEACSRIPPAVANVLTQYPWPGNVRELGNAIRHALAFMPDNEITMDSLPPRITSHASTDAASALTSSAASGRHIYLRAFLEQKAASDAAHTQSIAVK
ncbi:MAG: sigma-54-dependent transcriptional regulator [Kiritimatiellia bacterium]